MKQLSYNINNIRQMVTGYDSKGIVSPISIYVSIQRKLF